MITFDNYHLAISRLSFQSLKDAGRYEEQAVGLHIKECAPTYALFQQCLKTYGGPWGWDRRPKYFDNEEEISLRLNERETRLLTLHKDGREIGYCLIVGTKKGLSDRFCESANHQRIVEIENFALTPSENGKGHGRYFLARIFEDLLSDYDVVYLASRSTNHTGVIPFYKSMGMEVLHVEHGLPDDLVHETGTKVTPEAVI